MFKSILTSPLDKHKCQEIYYDNLLEAIANFVEGAVNHDSMELGIFRKRGEEIVAVVLPTNKTILIIIIGGRTTIEVSRKKLRKAKNIQKYLFGL